MAKIAPKGKKVTGTKKKDKITWVSSKLWKKNLTVNAGKGNDIINFKKSKYKNSLNGQDGNDIIYGGKNIDKINGGNGNDKLFGYNGNDIIKAGAGNDLIDGGNGNDQIYGESGTNTLKGGAGNDKIYGGSGNDSIYGDAGNDVISAGTGNDNIYGGAGNDTINAGKGNNRIIINKNNGTDTILNGGGVDTIVFEGFTMEDFYYSHTEWNGDDLELLGIAGGNKIILKNYAKGSHSVKYMECLGITSKIPFKYNDITQPTDGDKTYNGTNKPDRIFVNAGPNPNDYIEKAVIYGNNGDDYINLRNAMNFYLDPGKGDDEIEINIHGSGTIKLNKNSGSDTLNGIEYTNWRYNIVLDASTTTNGKFDNSLLVRQSGNIKYILGERQNDDLIIKLTDGNTFTVTNYYGQDEYGESYQENIAFVTGINSDYGDNEEELVSSYLLLGEPYIATLNKKNNTVDKSGTDTTSLISASEDANYSVKLGNSDSNSVRIEKNGSHTVTVGDGNSNFIGLAANLNGMETGNLPTPINGNQTVNVGNGNSNDIWISTTGNSNVTLGDGYGNDIWIANAKESTITTGNGNGNFIDSYATKNTITTGSGINTIYVRHDEHALNTINSYGNDNIHAYGGETTINLYGQDKIKSIFGDGYGLTSKGSQISQTVINNAEAVKEVNIHLTSPKSMPYYALYDDDNDGKYDLLYSIANVNFSDEVADSEIILKDAYSQGHYISSFNPDSLNSIAKGCDMERAGLTVFDNSAETLYQNSIVIFDSKEDDIITTGNSTIVYLSSGTNTVNYSGRAFINISGGNNTINLSGNDITRTITTGLNGTTEVRGIMDLSCSNYKDIPLSVAFQTDFSDNKVMVYHDATDNTDGLHFVTRNYEMDFVISDIYEDLNDFKDGAASKFVIRDQYGAEKDISKFTNYYDMDHHGVNEFSYEEISPAVNPSSGDWLIDGTDKNDEYFTYIPNYGNSAKIDIYDKGGNNDSLCFDSPFGYHWVYDHYENNSVFFNVEIQRNTDFSLKRSTFGDDLYLSGDISSLFDTDSSNDSYACIHNYFETDDKGFGYIESITDIGNVGTYKIDFDGLVELKNDIASWIANNTAYSSVADVIAKGTADQKETLMAFFTEATPFNHV